MARSSKGPRAALSPKYRTNPVKEEPEEAHSEALAEEALAPDDTFVQTGAQVFDWLVEQRSLLIGVAVLGLVVALGSSLYASHKQENEREVATAVFKASRQMPTVTGEVSAEDTTKFKEAAAALEKVGKEYEGAVAAEVAKLYAGYSFLQSGQPSEAVRVFQEVSTAVKEPVLKNFAYSGLAAAHGMAGNDEAALATLKTASTSLSGVFQQSALMDLGRALEGQSKGDEAASSYETLLEKHPYSAFGDDAKARLKTLKPDSALLKSGGDEAKEGE